MVPFVEVYLKIIAGYGPRKSDVKGQVIGYDLDIICSRDRQTSKPSYRLFRNRSGRKT